jgi:hypothetical protein
MRKYKNNIFRFLLFFNIKRIRFLLKMKRGKRGKRKKRRKRKKGRKRRKK